MRLSHPPRHLWRPRRRSAGAAVAIAALLATIGVGDAAAQSDVGPGLAARPAGISCPGIPRRLALIGNGPRRVVRVTRDGTASVARVRRGVITKAVRGRDGTIWVESRPRRRPNTSWRRIVRIAPDRRGRVSDTGDIALSHVGNAGPRGRATVATYLDHDHPRGPRPDAYGHVYVESSSGKRRSIRHAVGIESSVITAAPSVLRAASGSFTGVVALGSFVDLTEDFSFRLLRGGEPHGLFDPTDDAPYGQPPLFTSPILSPRGTELAWAEGPDWAQPNPWYVGRWTLVIADSHTGAESLRLLVGRTNEELQHADFDGRYWVGTFSRRMLRAPLPEELRVRVVDTHAASPRVVTPDCNVGFIASIDRLKAARS